MFCPKCGKELADSSRFCTACGNAVTPKEEAKPEVAPEVKPEVKPEAAPEAKPEAKPAKAPMSKAEKKAAWKTAKVRYKEAKKAKRASEKKGKKALRVCLKLALALLIAALAGLAVFFALRDAGKNGAEKEAEKAEAVTREEKKTEDKKTEDKKTEEEEEGGSIGKNNPPDYDMPEKYEPQRIDADEYFAENGKIVKETKASEAGRSEKDAYKNLTDRGFTFTPITTKYSIKGEYSEAKEITEDGKDKHPVYTTYYFNGEGEIWVVYEIGGAVMASPFTYNFDSNDTEVIVSESETVTSYDGTLNKFYETIPDQDVMKVIVVDKINAETLDKLTKGEIENYEYPAEQN